MLSISGCRPTWSAAQAKAVILMMLASFCVHAREPESAVAVEACMRGGRAAVVSISHSDKGLLLRLRLWKQGLTRAQNGEVVNLPLTPVSAFPANALGDAAICPVVRSGVECTPVSVTVRFSALTFGADGAVAGEVTLLSAEGKPIAVRMWFSAALAAGTPCT